MNKEINHCGQDCGSEGYVTSKVENEEGGGVGWGGGSLWPN